MFKISIIISSNASEGELHGAKELQKYLKKILAQANIPICCEDTFETNSLGLLVGRSQLSDCYLKQKGIDVNSLDEDGFVLLSFENSEKKFVILRGKRDRGTLYSIYTFLEKQGCRFFEPYHSGEVVPSKNDLKVDNFFEIENPTLPFRELDLDLIKEWNIIETTRLLDWAVKNKLNMIVLVIGRNDFIRFLPVLKNEIKKRDLSFGIGGHQIFAYLMLPAEILKKPMPADSVETLFQQYAKIMKEHPEWRISDLSPDFSDPCLSNPEVVRRLTDNLLLLLKHHPEIEFFRFQVSDGFDNRGHCKCEKCLKGRKFENSRYAEIKNHLEEVYFEAVKSIATEVERHFPKIYFAYTHVNTFGAPVVYDGRKKPDDMPKNVKYFYSCLENQAYNHPLSSVKYPRHFITGQSHHDVLKSILKRLKNTDRKLVVKEMHGSSCFSGMLHNTPLLIAQNMRWLYEHDNIYAGSMIFTNLNHQDHAMAWHTFGLNLYTYYSLAWNINENVENLLDDFYKKYFEEADVLMKEVYEIIENKAIHLMCKPFADCLNWGDQPTYDSIDEHHLNRKSLEFYKQIMEEVQKTTDLCKKSCVMVKSRDSIERMERELIACEYVVNYLNFTMSLYEAGYYYKKSKKSSSAKRVYLFDKCKNAMKEAKKTLDILNENSMGVGRTIFSRNKLFFEKMRIVEK